MLSAAAHDRLEAPAEEAAHAPTWRGWLIGLLCCALLAAVIPYIEFGVRCTRLATNLLPAPALALLFGLCLILNLLLGHLRESLKLQRADLVLVFCMTMLINAIPATGFMSYLVNIQLGQAYYARPESRWELYLHPYIPAELVARDPADPQSPAPRPVEWFYAGAPRSPEGSVWPSLRAVLPVLALPYARWCVALIFALGMFFALSAILHRQWSERERLPFPIAQVPQEMLSGLFEDGRQKPFLCDKLAWIGIGLTLLLHSWNALGDYVPNWAPLPLRYWLDRYLTEPPWRQLQPLWCHFHISAIAFMYLVSREVSFSLWFFYLVVFKLGVLIASRGFGLGQDGYFFDSPIGQRGIFINQGNGALIALVLIGFFMARGTLWSSLRQACGIEPREPGRGRFSPRFLWLLLAACLAGSVGWLAWYGVHWLYAVLAIPILLLLATGVARLVSEGGVLHVQAAASPVSMVDAVFTQAGMGPRSFILLTLWARVFSFDWYRMTPMTHWLTALHLGSESRVRLRPLAAGLAAALLVTFAVTFVSFHYTCFSAPGGARQFGTEFDTWPDYFYRDYAGQVAKIEAYREKEREYERAGRAIPPEETPAVARVAWDRLSWIGVGAAVLSAFLFLRTRVFWWPHPIGYVMWMAPGILRQLWFSYFLGWLLKALVLKFGGQRVYIRGRRLFVGLIVGEALAALLWIAVAWAAGRRGGYAIE
jgi:hypothetical protein